MQSSQLTRNIRRIYFAQTLSRAIKNRFATPRMAQVSLRLAGMSIAARLNHPPLMINTTNVLPENGSNSPRRHRRNSSWMPYSNSCNSRRRLD
ncbi:hypothetical protein CEXT_439851 [Caerostris extrusa]|uniref:Uncharacterized protein n=1 Tax=Caerostris extrusa TaxID=172846 RepID=A0AAV4YBK6_CAEEX|nr:hypothetical protein CEXT_439851 [Caerostris extrusa]